MFGPHLMLDCSQVAPDRLTDVAYISQFLDEFPPAIGMTKIMPPYVFRYVGEVPEDWGVSGVVIIAESHISLHTFPDKGYFSLDLFSCKDFDIEEAVAFVEQRFGPMEIQQQLVMRGREFPRSAGRAREIIRGEREQVAPRR